MSHPQDDLHEDDADQQFVWRDRVPVLWTYTDVDPKPVVEWYGEVRYMLDRAAMAAELGLRFVLDFYDAPINDTQEVPEAHLTVHRHIHADASFMPRSVPTDPEFMALLQVAGAARTYRMNAKAGRVALLDALTALDEAQS